MMMHRTAMSRRWMTSQKKNHRKDGATEFLLCLAAVGRDTTGSQSRQLKRPKGGKRKGDEVLERSRFAADVALRLGPGNAKTSAAHAIAVVACHGDGSASLGTAMKRVREEQKTSFSTRQVLANAFAANAKAAARRRDPKTCLRTLRRWQRHAREGLVLAPRERDAESLAAEISKAARHDMVDERWADDVVAFCARSARILHQFPGDAIAACVLDAGRNGKKAAVFFSDAAERHFGYDAAMDQPKLASAIVVANASRVHENPENVMTRARGSNLSAEALAALLTALVDEYKRRSEAFGFPLTSDDLGDHFFATKKHISRRQEMEERRHVGKIMDRYDKGKLHDSVLQRIFGRDRVVFEAGKAWTALTAMKEAVEFCGNDDHDRGLLTAKARALTVLGELEDAAKIVPVAEKAIVAVAADARFARIFYESNISESFLADLGLKLTASLVEPLKPAGTRLVPNHKRWSLAKDYVTEALRTVAVASRNMTDPSDLVDWAAHLAYHAARSDLKPDPTSSAHLGFPKRRVLTIAGVNALFEALVYVDRRHDAKRLLEAMRDRESPPPNLSRYTGSDENVHAAYYPGPNAYTFNVLLRDLARRHAHPDNAEDVITAMCNDGIEPNADTVAAMIDIHRVRDDRSAAVTAVQDLYNQFGVRPHALIYVNFLAVLLHNGDHYEARRAVSVLDQLWPADALTGLRDDDMLSDADLFFLFDHYGASLDHPGVPSAAAGASRDSHLKKETRRLNP